MPQDRIHTWKGDTIRKFLSTDDPYLSEEGLKTSICKGCHLVYQKKRWMRDVKIHTGENVHYILCPACQKIRDHYPGGYLTLKGKKYLQYHSEELMHIINNESSRAEAKNPLQRIMEIQKNDESWIITTTDEKLAQHLGREIHKAHAGEIEYQFGEENKVARVYWMRNGEP